MMTWMRASFFMLTVFMIAACQPSDLVKDRDDGSEPERVEVVIDTAAFPSGIWTDGLGNSWEIERGATVISGMAIKGPARGLTISGEIYGESLIYKITDSSNNPVSLGSARLVHAAHAWFEAERPDGTLAGHGIFHFDHEATDLDFTQLDAARAPIDLRPIPELEGG